MNAQACRAILILADQIEEIFDEASWGDRDFQDHIDDHLDGIKRLLTGKLRRIEEHMLWENEKLRKAQLAREETNEHDRSL